MARSGLKFQRSTWLQRPVAKLRTAAAAAAAALGGQKRGRPETVRVNADDPATNVLSLSSTLITECGLSAATAQRVAEAALRYSGISNSPAVLKRKIATLQRVLGPQSTNKALHAFPQLLSVRCALRSCAGDDHLTDSLTC